MDVRKRSADDNGSSSVSKKRILASANGSPAPSTSVISSAADEPREGDSLELFRKEAIYRRMRYYARESERYQEEVDGLNRRRATCEAGIAAIEACWNQLIEQLRLLVKPDTLPPPDERANDLFSLVLESNHPNGGTEEQYAESLQKISQTTINLVNAFVHLGPRAQAPDSVTLREQCQRYRSEVNSLRSELGIATANLASAEEARDRYREKLGAAEVAVDRAKSESVRAMERAHSGSGSGTDGHTTGSQAKDERDGKSSLSPAPTGSTSSPVSNGHIAHAEKDSDWRTLAENREAQLKTLSEQNLALQSEVNRLKLEAAAPPDELVTESALYKTLFEHASSFKSAAESSKEELTKLRAEVSDLRTSRKEFQDKIMKDATDRLDVLREAIGKRDEDNGRLRGERDNLQSEVHERRSRENERMEATRQYKALATSRADRITTLVSEVRRLRSALAAQAGQSDLFVFLSGNTDETASYVQDLKSRLLASEARCRTLMERLDALDANQLDIGKAARAEAEASQRAALLQERIDSLESVFGEGVSVPPDTKKLLDTLREREQMLKSLQLQQKDSEAATEALYTEVATLSTSWENADKLNQNKVFDLAAMEERITKAVNEKAKADIKYFSVMRMKEGMESERKALIRNVEKQTRVVDKLSDSEKSLTTQLGSLEKEISIITASVQVHKDKLDSAERELAELRNRYESEKKRTTELRTQLQERESALEKLHAEMRNLDDEWTRTKKELGRAKAAGLHNSGSTSSKELQLQSEIDKLMQLLRCSTCKQELKTHVLTKCMHTFCKGCIDARVSTRQRKCPACNLAFAQSDIQQIYFQ
ncbi:hypothetical protein BOTBODRAFT_122988 [Botryobasidium botryosum FD-172 SS1]|uniref:E3 ubiquitin protein ligase n=1 Tax=Botryobasidium botryosum (strain FD-172 SS1) TaxID=930990 RepID=A0A067NB11_BOTB1|nr:hypothetical protein BOTBODRAFT_122988 [Botryobasidium botryosum FD-172 SS1]